ncbi:MAG TPA: DNA-3-methyladenine glycosylase 2 family protein [Candidatus Thermoplasmatota archaeon]|nr:DNA-3-methyladenine glycosylase 2 family protein [Candidatus Thermoplasmatota archaeon]
MVQRLLADLPRAVARWDDSDPALAALARRPPPGPRPGARHSAFSMLARSIVHQQVSVAAGRTIYGRLRAACGGRVAPWPVVRLGERGLRSAGLSPQKARYVHDLARKVDDGEVRLRTLPGMDDAEAIETLTRVKGIGVWTAEMFLLFHLQRPDVLAVDDLGLQLGAAYAFGVPRPRARAWLERRRATWSPFGSLASLTLWDTLHRARGGV